MGVLVRSSLMVVLLWSGNAVALTIHHMGWYVSNSAASAACAQHLGGGGCAEQFDNPYCPNAWVVYHSDATDAWLYCGYYSACPEPLTYNPETGCACPAGYSYSEATGTCEGVAQCELTDLDCGMNRHVEQGACRCMYDECSVEMGQRFDGNPGGYEAGSGMCIGGCLFIQRTQMAGEFEGAGMVAVWHPNGSQCAVGPADASAVPPVAPEPDPPEDVPPPLTDCVWDENGNSYCTDAAAAENCGMFNDEYICLPQTDNCTRYDSGSVACTGAKTPVSGPEGTPETPAPVPEPVVTGTTAGPGTSTGGAGGYPSKGKDFSYWNAGQGVQTGWGLGIPVDPELGGTGTTSDSPDPELPVADPGELVQEQEEPAGGFDGAFDFGIPADSTCPSDTVVQIFGSYSFAIEWDLACELMRTIRPFVIGSAAATSLYLLVTMGR